MRIALPSFLYALLLSAADFDTFRVSRLECVIGNNAASGDHRAGYNGVFRITTPGQDASAYVPAFAGLNLEHYFDGRPRQSERVRAQDLLVQLDTVARVARHADRTGFKFLRRLHQICHVLARGAPRISAPASAQAAAEAPNRLRRERRAPPISG